MPTTTTPQVRFRTRRSPGPVRRQWQLAQGGGLFRTIGDFDQAVAKSSTPCEVIDELLAEYAAYGNRYTLFAAAFSQFPS